MKCRWYAEFEGVCTNGECPYRGDTCPTSEYPEVCKYAEKNPEIPQLSAEELAETLRLCGSASCRGCALSEASDCGNIILPQAADMLEKLAAERDAQKPERISVKDRLPEKTEPVNVTCEERTLKWLNDNIDFFTKYRANPINANRTAFYDEMIERQRVAISAIETCRQLKKSLFGKENVTNDELVRMVLQLKSGRWMQETGGRTMKTPDEIKLKPCPFCGGEAEINVDREEVEDTEKRHWAYTVVCNRCCATSGLTYLPEKAREAWNRRADNG